MNFLEYSKIINETAVYPKAFGPAYTVLGLVEETWELDRALMERDKDHIIKEAGDVLWYFTATMFEYELDPLDFENQIRNFWDTDAKLDSIYAIEYLKESVNKLASITKKKIRDNYWNVPILKMYMEEILTYLCYICWDNGSTINDCMKINYDKLITLPE